MNEFTDIASKMMEQYSKSDNPLEEPVIILIDEIDLHLHPKWQKSFLNSILSIFPNIQIIVTTHSPFIVSSIENAKVFAEELKETASIEKAAKLEGRNMTMILVSK